GPGAGLPRRGWCRRHRHESVTFPPLAGCIPTTRSSPTRRPMHRRLALLAVLAPLVLPAAGHAAVPGNYFAGEPVDGPSADIQSLDDLDVARDGTGAMAYVKRVGGIDHVFVSRLINGSFAAPEQVDAGLGGAGSQPTVAVSDNGRVVVAFASGGGI